MTNVLAKLSDDETGKELTLMERKQEKKAIEELRNKKDFKSYKELFQCLKDEANLIKEERAKKKDETKTDPKTIKLSMPDMVDILKHHLYYCLFDDKETSRVFFYDPVRGIYTANYLLLLTMIRQIMPYAKKSIVFDVASFLTTDTFQDGVKDITHSKYLIPVDNGIYNTKKHELIPFTHDYYFTTKVATKYNSEATESPVINGWDFDSWLNEIACGDEELVTTLWQVIADVCNGNYTRRKAIFLRGNMAGNNSKGTFQELIMNLVGKNNVGTLKVDDFDKRFRLNQLVGKSVCIGDDIASHIYIKDSSDFNSVITGDPVTIEYKGEDAYTTELTCTVVQSCNDMPTFKNKGGTMRRILIVPFNAHFTANDDNRAIKEDYLKRKEVLEYVLNKALNLPDFDQFTISKASKEAMAKFENDNNAVKSFIDDFFNEHDIDKVPCVVLFRIFCKYCKEQNISNRLTQKRFTSQVDEMIGDRYYYDRKYLDPASSNKLGEVINSSSDFATYKDDICSGKQYRMFIKRT